ncbi:zinc-finger domain-containing protein [Crenobacter cavernae]|uniref:Zinc-finger domain-containing protein n=1 Tax=Crenobacter cavernae TaxID=2290923 RepID=A0A345Y7W9_9NEIS|nr:zinc-finger domain-containing protein [Crenobacter cavernae]AXK40021.1 zinc-finger domain-containing protein [Crenobacter cavernae]RXZ42154.1 zinc-finger domain-containing protein [Crenobacter cavernae]
MAELKENTARVIEITGADLPLHCPTPDMVKWNSHPRVFLPIVKQNGEARCPYCGTLYKLTGPVTGHHH